MQAARIQPKRKRAEVKYYESDTSDSDAEGFAASSVEDIIPAKVRSILTRVGCPFMTSNHLVLENQSHLYEATTQEEDLSLHGATSRAEEPDLRPGSDG